MILWWVNEIKLYDVCQFVWYNYLELFHLIIP